jgi:flagellar hook protein FlgE
MMRSLYSAVSGMAGNTLRLDVIGNNIANVNTIGFKAGRVNFQETLGQVQRAATAPTDSGGGSNAIQIGTGTLVSAVDQIYTQGSLQMTGIHTDLAVQGNGLFVISNGEMNLYTRDGSFNVDSLGRMVASGAAHVVQGYAYNNATGEYATSMSDVYLPMKDVEPAKSTSMVTLSGNLDADSEPIGSYMKTSALYDVDGELASGSTSIVDLRQEVTGVGTLVEAGDTLYIGSVIGDEAVSAYLEVSSSTTLDDLAAEIANTLNSPEAVSGITVTVGTDGRFYVETPDQMGTAAQIQSLNLSATDASGAARGTFSAALAFSDIESARDAGEFVEESTVYDALGFAHTVKFTFTRVQGINEFTWEASVDEGQTEILQGGTGRVALRVDGSLDALVYDASGNAVPTSLSFNPGTGAESPMNVQLDGGTRGQFDGLTMLRGTQSLESSQNGYSKGTFTRFDIDDTGRVMGVFSNGVIRPISQLALAEFTNPTGLTRVGNNAYIESPNSGTPMIGISGEGIASTVAPGSLEQSNVDLTREFTDMIVAQRGFQSSARVITTTDEVLNELINIKR